MISLVKRAGRHFKKQKTTLFFQCFEPEAHSFQERGIITRKTFFSLCSIDSEACVELERSFGKSIDRTTCICLVSLLSFRSQFTLLTMFYVRSDVVQEFLPGSGSIAVCFWLPNPGSIQFNNVEFLLFPALFFLPLCLENLEFADSTASLRRLVFIFLLLPRCHRLAVCLTSDAVTAGASSASYM